MSCLFCAESTWSTSQKLLESLFCISMGIYLLQGFESLWNRLWNRGKLRKVCGTEENSKVRAGEHGYSRSSVSNHVILG